MPHDFEVLLGRDTAAFHLRPLTPAVVELDYAALMASIELLQGIYGRE